VGTQRALTHRRNTSSAGRRRSTPCLSLSTLLSFLRGESGRSNGVLQMRFWERGGGSFLASTIFFIREIHPLLSRIVNVSLYHLSNLQILTPLLLLLILPMCDAMRRLVGFVFSDDTAASGCLPCGEGLVHLLHEERLRTFSFFTLPRGDSPSTARLGPSRRTSYAGRSSTLLLGLDLLAGTPMIARTGLWSDPPHPPNAIKHRKLVGSSHLEARSVS